MPASASSMKAQNFAQPAGAFLGSEIDNLSIESVDLSVDVVFVTSQQAIDRGNVLRYNTNILVQSNQRLDFLVEIIVLGDSGTLLGYHGFLCVSQGFVVLGFQLMVRVCGAGEKETAFGD